MAWTKDWRIYYIAASLFLIAGVMSWVNDGLGLRPVFGLAMAIGKGVIEAAGTTRNGTIEDGKIAV